VTGIRSMFMPTLITTCVPSTTAAPIANKEPNRSVVRAAVRTTRQNSRTKEPITRKPPVKPISSAIPEKKEVVVRRRFRQVAEAGLRAVADALPAEAAATDRDDGLVDVPGDAETLGVDHLRGDEGKDTLALVVLQEEEPSLRFVLTADRAHGVLGLRIGLRVLVDLGRVFGQIDGHHTHQQDGGDSGHQEEPGGQSGDEKQDE